MATQTVIDSVNEIPVQNYYPSLFHGPADPPLIDLTLGEFLDAQCRRYGDRECVVIPWNGDRWTYDDLREQSEWLARYLLARGIQPGDRVAILAGNRAEYASVFFACMRLGAVLVILNNTYTTPEAEYALHYTGQYGLRAAAMINSLITPCRDQSIVRDSVHRSAGQPRHDQTLQYGRRSVA